MGYFLNPTIIPISDPALKRRLIDRALDEFDEEPDLRQKLKTGREESVAVAREVHEQMNLLDAAKEKLSGASSSVDTETVKKLQEMLNLAIEKTNQLQSQLPPRSVWDRIAPAEAESLNKKEKSQSQSSRFVKESDQTKDIVVTTTNKKFSSSLPEKKRYPSSTSSTEPRSDSFIKKSPSSSLRIKNTVVKKPNPATYKKPEPVRFEKKPPQFAKRKYTEYIKTPKK